MTDTHNSEDNFMGFGQNGRKIVLETIDIQHLEIRKMVEHWGRINTLSML
jgi:predicted ester cyclase